MFRKFLLTAMVAVIAPTISEAGFTLTVSDGSNYGTSGSGSNAISYNNYDLTTASGYSSGNLLSLSPITVTDANGTYTISATLVNSNTPGSASGSTLSLNTVQIYFTANAGQTTSSSTPLTIVLTGSGYNLPPTPVTATVTSSGNFVTTAPSGTATLSAAINGQTIQTETVTPKTDNTVGAPLTTSFSGTFTLTDTLKVFGMSSGSGGALQSGSINAFVSPVVPAPAPAGLVMLAGALPFAGLLRLRRRKVEVANAA